MNCIANPLFLGNTAFAVLYYYDQFIVTHISQEEVSILSSFQSRHNYSADRSISLSCYTSYIVTRLVA